MLFTVATLEQIAAGHVTVAFRRWRALRVREGSTVRTALGVVGVTKVEAIDVEDITPQDARDAGFATLRLLINELERRPEAQLYRIALRFEGKDPRVALRSREHLDDAERDALLVKIAAFGARSAEGPWAVQTLRLIDSHPATLAAKLAQNMGVETQRFKSRVRQLKELGLTESLDVGYQLSPRGRALLRRLNALPPPR